MGPPKYADLSLTAINCDAANTLKLKASVQLSLSPNNGRRILECRFETDMIGTVSEGDTDRDLNVLSKGQKTGGPKWPVVASVRTIKRDPESKQVSAIQERSDVAYLCECCTRIG